MFKKEVCMNIDVIKLSQIISALIVIGGVIVWIFKFIENNKRQDEKIKKIDSEQKIIIESQLACLNGLHQLGANGPVTKMLDKLEKHMIDASHE